MQNLFHFEKIRKQKYKQDQKILIQNPIQFKLNFNSHHNRCCHGCVTSPSSLRHIYKFTSKRHICKTWSCRNRNPAEALLLWFQCCERRKDTQVSDRKHKSIWQIKDGGVWGGGAMDAPTLQVDLQFLPFSCSLLKKRSNRKSSVSRIPVFEFGFGFGFELRTPTTGKP